MVQVSTSLIINTQKNYILYYTYLLYIYIYFIIHTYDRIQILGFMNERNSPQHVKTRQAKKNKLCERLYCEPPRWVFFLKKSHKGKEIHSLFFFIIVIIYTEGRLIL